MTQQIPWNWPLVEQGQIPQNLAQIATDFEPPWAAFLSQMAASPLPYVDPEQLLTLPALNREEIGKETMHRMVAHSANILRQAPAEVVGPVHAEWQFRWATTLLNDPHAAIATMASQMRSGVGTLASFTRDPWWLHAFAELAQDKHVDVAIDAILRATKLSADEACHWELAGEVYEHAGDATQAEEAYRLALALNPAGANSYSGLARLYRDRLNRPDEAHALFERAAEIWRMEFERDEDGGEQWVCYADLLGACLGRHEEAVSVLQRIVNAEASNCAAANLLGETLAKELGRYSEAEAVFRVTAESFSNAGGWCGLGVVLEDHMLRTEEAVAAYRKGLEVEPASAVLYANLVFLCADHERWDEAREWIQEARRQPELDYPASFDVCVARVLLRETEDREAAIRILEAASAPEDVEDQCELALLLGRDDAQAFMEASRIYHWHTRMVGELGRLLWGDRTDLGALLPTPGQAQWLEVAIWLKDLCVMHPERSAHLRKVLADWLEISGEQRGAGGEPKTVVERLHVWMASQRP